jgi:hypothetical protein
MLMELRKEQYDHAIRMDRSWLLRRGLELKSKAAKRSTV